VGRDIRAFTARFIAMTDIAEMQTGD